MGWAKQVEGKKVHHGEGSERGQSCGAATSWRVCPAREDRAMGLAVEGQGQS